MTDPRISIEAIRILKTRGHDVRLVVVGSSLGLPKAEGVEYRYATPEKVIKLICRAKALILPSSYSCNIKLGHLYVIVNLSSY